MLDKNENIVTWLDERYFIKEFNDTMFLIDNKTGAAKGYKAIPGSQASMASKFTHYFNTLDIPEKVLNKWNIYVATHNN